MAPGMPGFLPPKNPGCCCAADGRTPARRANKLANAFVSFSDNGPPAGTPDGPRSTNTESHTHHVNNCSASNVTKQSEESTTFGKFWIIDEYRWALYYNTKCNLQWQRTSRSCRVISVVWAGPVNECLRIQFVCEGRNCLEQTQQGSSGGIIHEQRSLWANGYVLSSTRQMR
jgi:hypothetical protein